MSRRIFDTLGTARDLETSGIERAQAEAIARAIGRNGDEFATKDDVARLEARVAPKNDIERLEAEIAKKFHIERLEAKIAALPDRAELYRALWIQGGGIVAILTALKFLP